MRNFLLKALESTKLLHTPIDLATPNIVEKKSISFMPRLYSKVPQEAFTVGQIESVCPMVFKSPGATR